MSRCFPYPPPGYVVSQFNAASMIESLKKVEKAKKERKEKKRDKKDKEKTRGCGEIDKKKQKDKRRHKDKRRQDEEKGQEHQKRRENEMEQVEKSNLTEEHGHQVSSQNSFESSDSTPSHNKKRHRSSSSSDGMKKSGSTIKFLLPCQSYKDDQTEKLGSDAGNYVQEGNVVACKLLGEVPAKASQHPVRTSGRETSHYASGASEIFSQKLKRNPPPTYCNDSPYELKFRSLFENLLPPQSCREIPEYDDLEWLFSFKQNHSRGTKRLRTVADDSSYKVSAPCSLGCYLPEADLYALPFTVPF